MKDIFRKDLNLNSKWWHRLFKILFIIILSILLIMIFLNHLNKSEKHYKLIDKLENRLNDKAIKIDKLIKSWEVFDSRSYWGYEWYWNFWKAELYCSNKLYDIDNIKYIINETWINSFNRFSWTKTTIEELKEIREDIKKNNIKCIIKDHTFQVDFLNPMESFNNDWFYKKDNLDYFLDSFHWIDFMLNILLAIVLYLILVYIIYYKIFLYIVFWKQTK